MPGQQTCKNELGKSVPGSEKKRPLREMSTARVQLTTPNKQQQRSTWLMHKYALSFYLSPPRRREIWDFQINLTRHARPLADSACVRAPIEDFKPKFCPRTARKLIWSNAWPFLGIGPIQSEHTHKTKLCLLGRWIREVLSGTVPAGRQQQQRQAGLLLVCWQATETGSLERHQRRRRLYPPSPSTSSGRPHNTARHKKRPFFALLSASSSGGGSVARIVAAAPLLGCRGPLLDAAHRSGGPRKFFSTRAYCISRRRRCIIYLPPAFPYPGDKFWVLFYHIYRQRTVAERNKRRRRRRRREQTERGALCLFMACKGLRCTRQSCVSPFLGIQRRVVCVHAGSAGRDKKKRLCWRPIFMDTPLLVRVCPKFLAGTRLEIRARHKGGKHLEK